MSQQERAYHLIEHILDLLSLLQRNQIDIDRFMRAGGQLEGLELPDPHSARMAYEIMQFMDEMPGGVLVYYAGGDEEIVYASLGVLRIFQCGSLKEFRELTRNSFRGLVHPDDLEAVEASIQEQVAASQYDLDYVEYRITRKDGEIRWIEDYGHFIRSETVGDLFYVFLSDATEKRNSRQTEVNLLLSRHAAKEQQLQSQIEEYDKERALINQEYLRRLKVIEGLSINYESIFYVDLEKDQILPYRLSSRTENAFEKRFHPRRFSQYIASYVRTWVYPEDQETTAIELTEAAIRRRLADATTYYINYRVLSGGELQHLQLRVVDAGHTTHGSQVVMGCRRVDEELQHEIEQKQMLAEALSNANLAIVAKNTFLSNMSHDMRTPLNAVFGYSSLIQKNAGDPETVRSFAAKLENASRQLLELVNKVLELSWTGANESSAADPPCDLRRLLEEVHAYFLTKAGEKGITFTLDCSSLTHKMVICDREKLKQLMLYLVNNAVSYTGSGGRILLSAAQQPPNRDNSALYRIVVEDSGIGIDPDFLEHIFEPFSRAQNTTHSGIHGAGLGLTIVKNIVALLGGDIDVKSAVGKGTVFTVTLRLQLLPNMPLPGQEPPPSGVHLSGCRILLVEDNPINQEIETELLRDLALSIEAVDNGEDAVEAVQRRDFDLVLMDIQMPGLNGWQTAEAIRALPDPVRSQVPIIALSANAFESDVRKSMACGMNAHLTKPLDIPALLKTAGEVLREHRG